MKLIAAADENWGIGKDGKLLFSLKQDMKFFRETTTGHIVVMGRKTLDSFPGKKPLKNRINIVLTRDKEFSREGVTVCGSVEEVTEEIQKLGRDDVFVIGGAQIYALFLPLCEEAVITKVHAKGNADTFIKNLDTDSEWKILQKSDTITENNIDFEFVTYKRIL